MAELTEVQLYTDGACSGNPGPGGYGAILRCNGYEKEISTNNGRFINDNIKKRFVDFSKSGIIGE